MKNYLKEIATIMLIVSVLFIGSRSGKSIVQHINNSIFTWVVFGFTLVGISLYAFYDYMENRMVKSGKVILQENAIIVIIKNMISSNYDLSLASMINMIKLSDDNYIIHFLYNDAKVKIRFRLEANSQNDPLELIQEIWRKKFPTPTETLYPTIFD